MRRLIWIAGVKHIQDVVEGDPSLGLDPQEVLEARRAAMSCSRFQVKAALDDAGLLADAEAAVQSLSARQQLAWTDQDRFTRLSPTINAVATILGLTETQVDDLFRQAATIKA